MRRGSPINAEVMVVDDQPSVVANITQHLREYFTTVVGLTDPAQAVRTLMEGRQFGVLLLDVLMQPVSGLDILRLVREMDAHSQVILMSANASVNTAISALKGGASDFVLKPIDDWDALARAIKRAMAEHDLRDENRRLLAELGSKNRDLDRAVQLLRRLNTVTELMHSSRDIRQILNTLLRSACEYLRSRRVSIMIRDPHHNELTIQMAEGIDEVVIKEERIKPGEGVAGTVLAQRSPIIVNRKVGAEHELEHEGNSRYAGQSFMSIPITLGGGKDGPEKVMGVLNVTDREGDRPFEPIEIEFALHLARQAALALTGAALWQKRGRKV